MATQALPPGSAQQSAVKLDHKVHPYAGIGFLIVLAAGLVFAGYNIFNDTAHVGEQLAIGAFLFLGLALLIALGFEFVNGFHDTANAVATVIYTHSLPPITAVIWSGCWNFIGVVLSSGAVAYSIITLLPVELILNVGSAGGYAIIFALLIAAVVWNLGTWWLGLPNKFEPRADRFDPRRRPCQSIAVERHRRHIGRRMGAGAERVADPLGEPDHRLRRRDGVAVADEAHHPRSPAL
jgi:PiT family inorganic phosphate transporter